MPTLTHGDHPSRRSANRTAAHALRQTLRNRAHFPIAIQPSYLRISAAMKTLPWKIAAAGLTVAALASWPHWQARSANAPELAFPPKLSGMIQEEMRLISKALNEIVKAVVTGEHRTVFEKGREIEKSFVLNAKTDSKDTNKLLDSLPQAFVAFDRKLHRNAKKLAEAAAAQKVDLERYYLSEMIENCVDCHKVFATHRFPSLKR